MVQPRKYTRSHDFTQEDGDTTDHSSLNAELDAAGISINGLRNNLALIQKDDGTLLAKIIKFEHLSDDAFKVVLASLEEAKFAAQRAASNAELAASQALRIRKMYDRYQGDSIVEPATRLSGDPLQPGDLYFNTTNNELCVYASTGWKTANNTYERSELYSRSEIDLKLATFNAGQPLQTEQVLNAIAQGSVMGGVGTHGLFRATGTAAVNPGDILAGATLLASSCSPSLPGSGQQGSWRCLGYCAGGITTPLGARITLFVRIA